MLRVAALAATLCVEDPAESGEKLGILLVLAFGQKIVSTLPG
jgi:hypothetical protein